MKPRLLFSILTMLLPLLAVASGGTVNVKFTGVQSPDKLALTISSSEYLNSIPITADGDYQFTNVPAGTHYVKAEGNGYNLLESLTVIVNEDGSVIPSEPLRVAVTKQSENPDEWNFSWYEDQSPGGYTTTSYVNKPVEIEFLGKKIVPSDVPSSNILLNQYNIILSDENQQWTQEYAYRMVETLYTLPVEYKTPAKFTLTDDHITDDITITNMGDGLEVCISKDAFYYANPFLVSLDGVRGRLFSKRLHHALTIFATDGGQNVENADRILWERFGCHILGVNYEELTGEDAGRFQMFAPTELVSIINMFEEMPEGFHKIPHLNYLIRRLNGHKHPIYPEAAAVTWPVENGYIEFMESAFGGNNQNFDTLRLILHEKTHMLWAFVFSDSIKNDWIEIGGWYIDPNSSSGWSTTKDVEFVTSYAHGINPNEDMAESVALYLKNPEALMSRSLPKYEFIRDRIMHGARYISKIPDHLTFEVLNLWPDYDYPGKINSIDIKVTGKEDEDKTITMEVGLQHLDGYEDGASFASTRISSPYFTDEEGKKHNQFVDLGMSPVDGDNHRLRGSVTVNKHSKLGHWITGDICLYDLQGNARYEGRNDCVTDVYINNPMEDLEPTKYVPGSLEYELQDTIVEGHECQKLTVKAKITDNIGVERVVTRIYADVPGFNDGGTGFTDSWGYYYDPTTQIASTEYLITEFYPTAEYYITFFDSYDSAGTETETKFSNSPEDQPIKKIYIKTKNPDTKAPEVDLNRLFVYAEPTHPDAPDGETKVTVNFYARDDKSGFGPCSYNFKDPQGLTHGDWFYHDNQGLFFNGDPTLWKHYQIIHILPQGSAPGIWGLSDLMVGDHACNQYTYNFVETLIFEPDESGTDYVLFSELNDNILSLGLNGIAGETYGFTWRIINEDTGAEINGASDDQAAQASLAAKIKRVSSNRTTDIDISALGDGNLIIIVNAFDAEGNILTVKSAHVEKRTIILADKVTLNATEMTLNTGESATMTATLSPEDTSDKSLTWVSSNEEVATVSQEGIVTAIKAGTATITVTTANGKSASCEVTVIQLAEGVTLNAMEMTLNTGESATLTATLSPEDTSDKSLTWASSNEEVATVSQEGVVSAIKAGTATISVTTTNGKSASCEVTVIQLAEGVTLNAMEMTLNTGESATLTATLSPEDTSDKSLTWASSNEEVATVSQEGVVTAIKAGTATITVTTANGKSASCEVTVIQLADGVTLNAMEMTLNTGESATLTATLSPEDTSDKTLTWNSSNEEVATVSQEGVVTAIKAGTVTISVTTANGKSASCEVTVIQLAEGVTLNAMEMTLNTGESATLTATLSPEDTSDKSLTWASSNEEVATVSQEGIVTAIKAGTATITVTTANGKSASCEVTVIQLAEGVTLNAMEMTLNTGESATLTATLSPEDTSDKTLTWNSSNEEVATVSQEGVVTAIKAGTATISVTTANGKSASCEVTVIQLAEGVTLNAMEMTLNTGESATLTATLSPEDTSDKSLTWASSNEEVATVSQEGVVTAIKAGTATITVTTANGKSASCEVTVIQLAEGVTLNAMEMTLNTGESATLTATLSPEDTSDKSLTWASSNEEVATVSQEGVVTAIKAGTATITVTTANGKSAKCDVTVIQLAEEIAINETEIKLNIGENITLTATIYPEDTTDKTIYWEIEDETIASVNEEGIVSALAEGTTTISASTQNGLIATCIITVVDPNGVESILQEKTFDIYTLQGVLIKSNATKEDVKRLDQGFYIIAGKKVFVR